MEESKTGKLIKDAPTPEHDKFGEWQETSGEIQWVLMENAVGKEEKHKKEEDGQELDLNKGVCILGLCWVRVHWVRVSCLYIQSGSG